MAVHVSHTVTATAPNNTSKEVSSNAWNAEHTVTIDLGSISNAMLANAAVANLSGTNTGDQDLSGLVPVSRTVNGKPLSANVTLTASDVGAAPAGSYAALAGSSTQQFSVADATAAHHGVAYGQADSRYLPIEGGSENPVINGEALIDQANAGAAVTVAVTTPTYLVDMWYGFTAGATVQAQQVAGSGEFQKALQATGATSVTAITLGTRIESKNAAPFVNQTVTCTAWISNSLLTSVTWTAYYPTVADTFSTKTQIATGTLTVNSTDAGYTFSFPAGANVVNGLCVEFSVGAQTSGTFKITGVDIVAGTQSRPYPHLTYERVLSQCRRYFQSFSGTLYSPIAPGFAGSTTTAYGVYKLSPSMRIAPTNLGALTASNFGWSQASGTIIATGFTLGATSNEQVTLQLTAVGLTAGAAGQIYFNATASLSFTGARL